MMFLERLTSAGILNSDYYVFNGNDVDLPNCTRYCYDRAKESCWDETLHIARKTSGFGNAKTWWDTTTYPKGSEIRAGAIAVFDGNCGHVAYVERPTDATHGILTDSQYDEDKSRRDDKFWRKYEAELVVGKATIKGVGKLLGFIYCPIDDIRTSRDTSVDQVEITEDAVNVRQSPGLSAKKWEGRFCPVGIFNVKAWDEADGYTWAKLDTGCWVACGSWANIYKAKDTPSEEDPDVTELVKELNNTLKEVKAKVSELEKENKLLNEKVTKLEKELATANDKITDAKAKAEDLVNILS